MQRITAIFLLLFLAICAEQAGAQSSDSTQTLSRPNIIKLNISSRFLYNNSWMLSYERVLKNNRSFAVTGGYLTFPAILAGPNTLSSHDHSASGFSVGAEYRMYMKKENRYGAPHGLYWGPYASYYSFSNSRDITSTASGSPNTATLDSKIGFTNLGIQLGYQFVLNNRWTVDVVFFGPSITNYDINLKLNGTFNVDEQNQVIDALLKRFPLIHDLIDADGVNVNGTTNVWSPGYRYSFQVGYKFGGGKGK